MAKPMEVLGMLVIAGATGSVAVFAVGLFGLISLELELQKKDYAVRRALGATALDVWMKIVMRGSGFAAAWTFTLHSDLHGDLMVRRRSTWQPS